MPATTARKVRPDLAAIITGADHRREPHKSTLSRRSKVRQENKMTSTTDTPTQPASGHQCCGGHASNDRAAPAVVAESKTTPSSVTKRSASAEAAPCCCQR